MELTSKQKGILTEEIIKLWFIEHGITISIPIGDNSRYDLIADFNGKLIRFQCKTGNLTRTVDCLNFACASIKNNSTGNHRTKYTENDIDYFCTINPNTRQVYFVPVSECGNECDLRYTLPKNNQKKGIKMAEDYEAEKFLNKI